MSKYTLVDCKTGLVHGPYETCAMAHAHADAAAIATWEIVGEKSGLSTGAALIRLMGIGSQGAGVNASLFPLANAESYLRQMQPALDRVGETLRWPSGNGLSELSVTPIHQQTFDGLLVSELVILTHTSPTFANLDREKIIHLNSWATISSLVPADQFGPTRFVAKVGIFSVDREAAERLYAPLICTEAAIVGWHAARMVQGEFRGDPECSPLILTGENPPYGQTEFAAIKAITDRAGYVSSFESDRHFTVELPWEPGSENELATTARLPRTRARLAQPFGRGTRPHGGKYEPATDSHNQHPLYGKGVLTTLELPIPIGNAANSEIVTELNAWELSGADLPPHFGAWCIGLRGTPAYVSFMPTQFLVGVSKGFLQNLIVWMAARPARVREWLNASPSRH